MTITMMTMTTTMDTMTMGDSDGGGCSRLFKSMASIDRVMSDAAYDKADEAQRVAMLDAVRMGAETLAPRRPVSRPERIAKVPVDNAPRHVSDPLLK